MTDTIAAGTVFIVSSFITEVKKGELIYSLSLKAALGVYRG